MIDIDHEAKRGAPFCPIMGECCTGGTTRRMKGARCAGWRGVPMVDLKTNMPREVHACAVYEWPVFQAFEMTTLLQQGRASTDKVASETRLVAVVAAGGQAALDQAIQEAARAMRSLPVPYQPVLLNPTPPNPHSLTQGTPDVPDARP